MGKKPVKAEECKHGVSAVLRKAKSFLKTLEIMEEAEAGSFTQLKTKGEKMEWEGDWKDPLNSREGSGKQGLAEGVASGLNGTVELPGSAHQKVSDVTSGPNEQAMDHIAQETDHLDGDAVTSCAELQSVEVIEDNKPAKQKRRRKKKGKCLPMPPDVASDDELRKYWAQRYRLFSRFDNGIMLDRG